MVFLYLFIGVLLHWISPIYSTSQINCSLYDAYTVDKNNIEMTYNGVVSVIYERDDLAVYRNNLTHFVNFLIYDSEMKFNGVFSKGGKRNITLSTTIPTNIEGVALLKKYGNKAYSLINCQLNLKNDVKYREDIAVNIQERVVELAHACIQPKLCAQLRPTEQDDYLRATIEHHDFRENSVMYKILGERYPNLDLPNPKTSHTTLQSTLNLLADFWLASLATQISGKDLGQMDIPNVTDIIPGVSFINDGYFKLIGGTFGDLKKIKRSQDAIITNTGLEFAAETGLHLSAADVHYNQFIVKYGVFSADGQVQIHVNDIQINIRIEMNYNQIPCKIAATKVHSEVGELSFKLSDNSIFDGMISGIANMIIRKSTDKIVGFLETKIEQAINGPLQSFDCEKFRP